MQLFFYRIETSAKETFELNGDLSLIRFHKKLFQIMKFEFCVGIKNNKIKYKQFEEVQNVTIWFGRIFSIVSIG